MGMFDEALSDHAYKNGDRYARGQRRTTDMQYRPVAEDHFDAMEAEINKLKSSGLDHVEAHLVSQWRDMTDTQKRKLLETWRGLMTS